MKQPIPVNLSVRSKATSVLLTWTFAAALAGQLEADTFTLGTLAGSAGSGNGDGLGPSARFVSPFGLAVDASGNLYVADFGNNTVRKESSPA